MIFLDTILAWACFVCICAAVLVSPWLFGAWEMWWFWPFAASIFMGTFFFSIRLILRARGRAADLRRYPLTPHSRTNSKLHQFGIVSFVLFLSYAVVRFFQADVFMDAERSFLLFLTPFLLGVQIVSGFSKKQLKLLYAFILTDLALLGLYGIVNHFVTGSRRVLWTDGYPLYFNANRATGSYFCPDHFAGIMELAFCLALGILLARGQSRQSRLFSVLLSVIAVYGVVLSKSRGGGLTILVIAVSGLIWGFSQWPAAIRWCCRISVGVLLALVLVLFCTFARSYVDRFTAYFGWARVRQASFEEIKTVVIGTLRTTGRGRMIPAAIRAWKTEPVFGVGPGMHQNLWRHFAATPDGDRDAGVWPTFPNYKFHSYEVHSDWIQLLEEYGLVGFVLFLVPVGAVFSILLGGLHREAEERRQNDWRDTGRKHHSVVLGGVLACVCMGFHSLGDFNLQIPATAWLFAAILATPIAYVLRE